MNRARIISDELRRVSEAARESDLDCQKYMAALSVLVDLSLQGWIFDFQDHQLTLKMENDSIDDKEKIRYRLSAERNSKVKALPASLSTWRPREAIMALQYQLDA